MTLDTGSVLTDTIFKGAAIQGDAGSYSTVLNDCSLRNIDNFNGNVYGSELGGTIKLDLDSYKHWTNCVSNKKSIPPVLDFQNTSQDLVVSGYKGNLKVINFTGGSFYVYGESIDILIDSSCTGGNIYLTGNGVATDNSVGTTVSNRLASPEKTADAVWDEDLTDHDTKGSAGSAQQASLYDNAVTIDVANGEAGTSWPVGTHRYPVNNLADALVIAVANDIDNFYLHGPLTIGATDIIDGYVFIGHEGWGAEIILIAGCSANETQYRYLMLSGEASVGDTLLIESCTVGNLTNFNGVMNIVNFAQGAEITIDSWANILEATAGGDPANEPEITLNSASVVISKYTGNIKLKGKAGGIRTTVGCTGANIIIDSTCTGGTIQLLGQGHLEADNSGAGCTVDLEGFLSQEYIEDAITLSETNIRGVDSDDLKVISDQLDVAQADLDDPDQYKADISALALEATLQLVKAETDKITSMETLIAFISDIEGGRWKIENNQMIFYKDDNVTEVARFNLYDEAGDPAETDVFERERV
jgi:hypothetical protein